jgi:hypothetical protein
MWQAGYDHRLGSTANPCRCAWNLAQVEGLPAAFKQSSLMAMVVWLDECVPAT